MEKEMTVAAITGPGDKETFVTVTFTLSQRFYKLPNDADPVFLDLLKESKKNHTPVMVKRANEASDVIIGVRKP